MQTSSRKTRLQRYNGQLLIHRLLQKFELFKPQSIEF